MQQSKGQLGKFLKDRREEMGLSQNQVARKLGYSSPQFVSNWERGLSSPPQNVLATLVDLYRISPTKIIDVIVGDVRKNLQTQLSGKTKSRSAVKKRLQ